MFPAGVVHWTTKIFGCIAWDARNFPGKLRQISSGHTLLSPYLSLSFLVLLPSPLRTLLYRPSRRKPSFSRTRLGHPLLPSSSPPPTLALPPSYSTPTPRINAFASARRPCARRKVARRLDLTSKKLRSERETEREERKREKDREGEEATLLLRRVGGKRERRRRPGQARVGFVVRCSKATRSG